MSGRCQAILIALFGIAKHYKKKYCWPSQKRIEELVLKYERLGIPNRTLNRDLRWLEENGYISRLRRIRVGPGGKLIFCSTLYKFKGKAYNFINSLGNIAKSIFSFFRLPKWADYKVSQRPNMSFVPGRSVENLLITDRDGSVSSYNPHTGEVLKVASRH